MTSTTPDERRSQAQSMTTLHTLADLIGEYEDELAACKREFSEALRVARMRAGLSLADVATAAGCTRAHVAYIEGGRYGVTRDTAHRLADAVTQVRRAG